MNIPNVQFPNVNHLMHAYRVAPWRVQRQWIGNVLLAVVVLAMVAALYLNITSQTAVAGREIQDLNNAILISQQTSSDLHTQLASLTSATAMETRALALGFRPIESGEVEYLVVPGYVTPQPINLASESLPQLSALTIPPEFNQSLLDWMDERLITSRGLQ
jgi:hypothetical protein